MIHQTPIKAYAKHRLEEFPKDLCVFFREFVENPSKWYEERKGVFIWGPEGTGKSSLVGALHKALADKKYMVHWVDCAAWPDDYEESDDMKKYLSQTSTRIVIWDDLGKEPANTKGDVVETLFARHKLDRGVDIFTANLNLSPDIDTCELAQKYGASLRSRIKGMCGDSIIQYLGVDRRMEAK